jgi:photosystem II stability/assembly factor-like uncharacterized protein
VRRENVRPCGLVILLATLNLVADFLEDNRAIMRQFALLALMAAASGAACAGTNEWTSLGPDGGGARALVVDPLNPGTVYAVTFAGVSKSTDGGASWRATSPVPTTFGGVHILAIDPQSGALYAAIDGGGMFKSPDGGATWNAINSGLTGTYTPDARIFSLAIDPQNSSTLYAASDYGGVFKTINGGASWSAMNSGLPLGFGVPILAVAIDPQTPRTLHAVTGFGVFKSTDGAATWSKNSELPGRCFGSPTLLVDPQNPATLLYLDSCSGVFKSTDGGASWNAATSGLPAICDSLCPIFALAFDPRNSSTIYASGYAGVYKSTDGAASWTNSGLNARGVGALAVDPQDPRNLYAAAVCCANQAAVFKSTDAGANWITINSGLRANGVSGLVVDPQNPGTLYANANGGLIKSTDGGRNWSLLYAGSLLALDPQNSNTLYANARGGLVKSTDAGISWNPANTGLPEGCVSLASLSIDAQITNTLYAGYTSGGDSCSAKHIGGVWKSADGGASWERVGSTPSGGGVHGLAVDPHDPGTLYAWNGMGLFQSKDAGASWNPLISGYVHALAVDPQNSSTVYASTNAGMSKSTDGGATWSAINSGLPTATMFVRNGVPFYPVSTLAIDPRNLGTIYAGTGASGVFRTIDGGVSWNAVNSGLTTLSVGSLAIDTHGAGTLYAGTPGGVFAITFAPQAQEIRAAMRKHADSVNPKRAHAYAWRLGTK